MRALHWLRANNHLYENVEINQTWEEDCAVDDSETWDELTGNAQPDDDDMENLKYRKSKRNYKQNKSIITKSEMNKNAKEYKRIMNKYINEHKNIMKEKIDNLKSNNPREFWKIINDNKKNSQ